MEEEPNVLGICYWEDDEYSQFFEKEDATYRIDWVYDPCGNNNTGLQTLIEGPTKIAISQEII